MKLFDDEYKKNLKHVYVDFGTMRKTQISNKQLQNTREKVKRLIAEKKITVVYRYCLYCSTGEKHYQKLRKSQNLTKCYCGRWFWKNMDLTDYNLYIKSWEDNYSEEEEEYFTPPRIQNERIQRRSRRRRQGVQNAPQVRIRPARRRASAENYISESYDRLVWETQPPVSSVAMFSNLEPSVAEEE